MLHEKATSLLKLRDILLRQLDLIENDYLQTSKTVEETSHQNAELLNTIRNSLISRAIASETISKCYISKDGPIDQHIIELTELQQSLHREILLKTDLVNSLKRELVKRNEKSAALKMHSRQLWTKLAEMKSNFRKEEAKRHESLQVIEDKVKHNMHFAKCVHHILQSVVLASKIDWAKDEELAQIMQEDVHNLFK